MNKVIIVDSCCNLPEEFFAENKELIHVLNMPVKLGDLDFEDDHGKTVSNEEFYQKLREGVVSSTSLINANTFYDKFQELHTKGKQILYIGFSSGMSGTYSSSNIAKEMFLQDYPDALVECFDSLCASSGYGALILDVVTNLKENPDLDVLEYVGNRAKRTNHFFSVDDLMFLKRGGRIPPAMAAIGTILDLKPLMSVDNEGKIVSIGKARGKKKAMSMLVENFSQKRDEHTKTMIIGHGDCFDDASRLKDMMLNVDPALDVQIVAVSPTIGTHVGPGLLVIGFIGNNR